MQAGIGLEPGRLLAAARIVISGDVTATAAFREGRVRIQDEGSQLIGELAAGLALDRNRKTILDACAAPGGKTLILAERNPAGADRGLRIECAAACASCESALPPR